eukprot:GILI01031363.1.p1 GENE.GILI01031363.1~~GILI01031363.1.p1  ORF type:complete len:312 (+),score=51.99 GILI01031363.1:137-937(+)
MPPPRPPPVFPSGNLSSSLVSPQVAAKSNGRRGGHRQNVSSMAPSASSTPTTTSISLSSSSTPSKDKKSVCHWSKCMKSADPSELLCCSNPKCGRSFHPECGEPPLQMAVMQRFKEEWLCNECEVCCHCKKVSTDQDMILCEACDRCFHPQCLNPPLKEVPSESWYCSDCVDCYSCGKKLPPPDNSSFFRSIHRVCAECHGDYEKGNICPACDKSYSDDSSIAFVCCDYCERWIHAHCDKLDEKAVKKISSSKDKYKCPCCRKNQP